MNNQPVLPMSKFAGSISDLYSRLAWIYDFFTDHEIRHHREAVKMADIKKDHAVLEVACGTGRGTIEIAKYTGDATKIHAVDLTEAMLKRAGKKLERLHLTDRIELKMGDARELPYQDNTFDLVYNSYMFDLINTSDMPAIISEFQRVLKPGGKVVLLNMSKNTERKTLYEKLYEIGLLGSTSGSCRPVLMKPYLEKADFKNIKRVFRKNLSWFFMNYLHGSEIVVGVK